MYVNFSEAQNRTAHLSGSSKMQYFSVLVDFLDKPAKNFFSNFKITPYISIPRSISHLNDCISTGHLNWFWSRTMKHPFLIRKKYSRFDKVKISHGYQNSDNPTFHGNWRRYSHFQLYHSWSNLNLTFPFILYRTESLHVLVSCIECHQRLVSKFVESQSFFLKGCLLK